MWDRKSFNHNGAMQDYVRAGNMSAGIGRTTDLGPYAFADFNVPFMDENAYSDNRYNTPLGQLQVETGGEGPGVFTSFYPNEQTMHYVRALLNALGANDNLTDRGYPNSAFTDSRGARSLY